MNYKLALQMGSLKTVLYYSNLRQAEEYLKYVKRKGGTGRVFKRGKDGQFKEVIAS